MSCPSVVTIQPTECIGNSLNTINNNYLSLQAGVCDNYDLINELRTLLFDLSAQPRGIVLSQSYAQSSAKSEVIGTQTYIPWDNTPPQITEGIEFLTITTPTPRSQNSKFLIQVSPVFGGIAGQEAIGALFRNGVTNALAAKWIVTYFGQMDLLYLDSPNSLTPVTYSFRVGQSTNTSTAGIVLNDQYKGAGAGERFGSSHVSTMSIQEIL